MKFLVKPDYMENDKHYFKRQAEQNITTHALTVSLLVFKPNNTVEYIMENTKKLTAVF